MIRHTSIPNLLSWSRLFSIVPLHLLVQSGHLQWAAAGLVVAGGSDVLDGFLARRWNCESSFGDKLDSAADNALGVGGFFWLLMLYPTRVLDHWGLAVYCVVLFLAPALAGYFRFGSPWGFHIRSARLAACLAYGAFVYVLLDWPRPSAVPFYFLAAAITAKAVEETRMVLKTSAR